MMWIFSNLGKNHRTDLRGLGIRFVTHTGDGPVFGLIPNVSLTTTASY